MDTFRNIRAFSFAALAASATLLSSCGTDDSDGPGTVETSSYVFSLRAQGSANESADYLITHEDLLSGDITAVGSGIEQLGWCHLAYADDTFFSISYDGNECTAYTLQDGVFLEKGKFAFERMDCLSSGEDDNLVAIGAPWGGGSLNCSIQIIDTDDVSIEKKVITPLYSMSATDTLNKWPSSVVVRDNKLFVSFYPLAGSTWETPIMDTAYVSIYSYPGLELEKTIKDTRTGPIGYYGSSPALLSAENGDIYTLSTNSAAAGFTQPGLASGILRINNGETEFDDSYLFDFEAASGGKKLLTGVYVGNGKAVARVVAVEESFDEDFIWEAFDVTSPICKLVVLDLASKTVTDIAEVPLHGGQYRTPFLVEDGKVYVSINDGTEAYLYEIDAATATAVKGAKIIGSEAQAIYKVN